MVNAVKAQSLKEALAYRAEQKAIPLAGGTDLLVKRKSWAGALPAFDTPVLFIGDISELKGCRTEDGMLKIGAAEKLADIAGNAALPEALRRAAREMASPAIRNMGTLGGNICNASPAGDTLPALYAQNAFVTLQSLSGTRVLPIEEFIEGPGATKLKEDELLTSVNIPLRGFTRVYYRKIGTRKADALSKVSFTGLADIREGRVQALRIAIGAVAPTVVKSAEAEDLIAGRELKYIPGVLPEILGIYSQLIRPIDDQRSTAAYRKEVSLRLLEVFITGLMS